MDPFDVRRHKDVLASHSLSLPEWYVLSTIGSFPVPIGDLPNTSVGLSDGDPRGPLSLTSAREAIRACKRRNLLTIVDQHYLSLVDYTLQNAPAIGPIYGLPHVEDVDFLPEGAKLFMQVRNELHPELVVNRVIESDHPDLQGYICLNRERAMQVVREKRRLQPTRQIANPKAIRRWRVYWWEQFDHGVYVGVSK